MQLGNRLIPPTPLPQCTKLDGLQYPRGKESLGTRDSSLRFGNNKCTTPSILFFSGEGEEGECVNKIYRGLGPSPLETVFRKMALRVNESWIRQRVQLKHDNLGKIFA